MEIKQVSFTSSLVYFWVFIYSLMSMSIGLISLPFLFISSKFYLVSVSFCVVGLTFAIGTYALGKDEILKAIRHAE